jgi:hypothetical protein
LKRAELIQLAYTLTLRHFVEHGRGPHYLELTDHLELTPDGARELQWETAEVVSEIIGGCWMSHDTDFIESWAPFSNVPTHHLISVDGKQIWYGQ